jgi:FMN phosphatase YigB (HAD superfamily)
MEQRRTGDRGPEGIANAAAAVGAPEILQRVRAETWVQRDGVCVDRHHWRVLHEPETFMAAELVEPFLAALDPPLFDDARPALDALRGRVQLALLTNNPFGVDVLVRHGLDADVEGAHAAGLRAVWLDRWDDAWTPPAGVLRIGSLTELVAQC